MKIPYQRLAIILSILLCQAEGIIINDNPTDKTIIFGNSKMNLTFDYCLHKTFIRSSIKTNQK